MNDRFSDRPIIDRILNYSADYPTNAVAQESSAKMLQTVLNYRICMQLLNMVGQIGSESTARSYSRSIDSMVRGIFSPISHNRETSQIPSRPIPMYSTSYPLFSTVGRATTNAMDQYMETILYDTSMSETRCAISFDDFTPGEEIARLHTCGHYFKKTPLQTWLQRRRHCPVCRRPVFSLSTRGNTYVNPVNGNTHAYSNPVNGNTYTNTSDVVRNLEQDLTEYIMRALSTPTSANTTSNMNMASYIYTMEIPISSASSYSNLDEPENS